MDLIKRVVAVNPWAVILPGLLIETVSDLGKWCLLRSASSHPDYRCQPHSLNTFYFMGISYTASSEINRVYESWAFIFIVCSWPQRKAWNYGMSAEQKGLLYQQELKMYFKYQPNLRLIFEPQLTSPRELGLARAGNSGFLLKLPCQLFLHH